MSAPAIEPAGIRVDLSRGAPSDLELAAVVAVVSEAYEREAAAAVVEDAPVRHGWELAARGLRRPLDRAAGWGNSYR
ncbi:MULTISPECIES: acyl-CoA carboxylase epsilon subunit [unclassified Microbacterium]|uniref:acyl-CoA carboxylase epsilon subunit n=1 Tax=unclassified Microbacterium TaxID=2609290 RepID=UPI00214BE91B|nr:MULTISPECIES: acyl-CoA carboxylase epsilon subunit [unclassified Microbacterium]MCR2785199.1 acyl-CoA carboxylase subunit epsilon [Microbacterium sp. zg.B96]WIM16732.1 acyl-CoA carboxylase epsilon subunit [Microbacterium sp. zg-B96]